MHVITAQNVNDALLKGMTLLATQRESGLRETRNGPAYVFPEPVTTHYRYPMQRVLFSPERDANPFFHLLEALWMLDGQRDVKRMAWLVPRMAQYSDDGVTQHGAYGYRWRHWIVGPREPEETVDQITEVIALLKMDPSSRRAILSMWNPLIDFPIVGQSAKDLPCNTTIKFSIDVIGPDDHSDTMVARPRYLNMVVFNRSNDIIMGAYGANAVHLSVLQEYVAAMLGVRVGWYEQISCDWHAYKEEFDTLAKKITGPEYEYARDPYMAHAFRVEIPQIMVKPLVDDPATFDDSLEQFLAAWERESWEDMYEFQSMSQFIDHVACPMLWAYHLYRDRDAPFDAYNFLEAEIEDEGRIDWLVAGRDWMRRRVIARTRKQEDLTAVATKLYPETP